MLRSNLVTTVHKFEFRLLLKRTPNKWRPVGSDKCSERDLCFATERVRFLRKVISDIKHPPTVSR